MPSTTRSTTSNPPPEDEAGKALNKIAAYLESIVVGIIHAVNTRSLDPKKDSIYAAISIDFLAIPAPPASIQQLSLPDYLSNLEEKIERHPEYHVELLTLDTVVDEDSRKGVVLMNQALSGIPEGVIRHAVTIWSFRRDSVDGLWRLTSLEVEQGFTGDV